MLLAVPMLLAVVALGSAAADEAARSELLAHASKVAEAKSYAVEYAGRSARGAAPKGEGGGDEGGEAEDGAGRGRSAGRGGEPWKVEFARGQPVHYVRGRADLWVSAKKISYKDPKEAWVTVDRPEPAAPGVEEGAEGGETPRVFRTFQEVERIPLPHELMAALAASTTDVTRTEEGGNVVYVAALTSDGARRFAGLKPAGAAIGKAAECSGTLRVGVADGVVEALEVDVVVKSANERRVQRTFELSGLDATEVVVPPEVAAAHAGKPEPPR